MSQPVSAAGAAFWAELQKICDLPAGPEKERQRKAWAERLAAHYSRKPSVQKDWQRQAANDSE